MAQAQMTTKIEAIGGGRVHGLRNTLVGAALAAMLAAGGWWAYQNGMLSGLAGTDTQAATAVQGVQSTQGTNEFTITGQVNAADAQTSAGSATSVTSAAGATGATSATEAGGAVQGQANAVAGATSATGATEAADASGAVQSQAAQAQVQAEAAPLPVSSLLMVSGVDGSTLYADDGKVVATVEAGDTLTATARSTDSTWLLVQADTGSGWVQETSVIGYGGENLALQDAPQAVLAAAAQPAETATEAASTTITTAAGETLSLHAVTSDGSSTAAGAAGATTDAAAGAGVTATVNVSGSQLNVRSGPGTTYDVVSKASAGDSFTVVARNADGSWLQVKLSDGSLGWASAQYLTVSGDASTLPVGTAA